MDLYHLIETIQPSIGESLCGYRMHAAFSKAGSKDVGSKPGSKPPSKPPLGLKNLAPCAGPSSLSVLLLFLQGI